MASSSRFLYRYVIQRVGLVLAILSGVSLFISVQIGIAIALGALFGGIGFWLLVRAQTHLVGTRHYGQFFLFFLARLLCYGIPIALGIRYTLSLVLIIGVLFSYKLYFIGVLGLRSLRLIEKSHKPN